METEILRFLNTNKIYYVTSGPNVAKGNVNIRCPFCGDADHAQHMGISLSKGFYGCWRSKSHRGTDLSIPLSSVTGLDRRVIRDLIYGGKGEVQQDPGAFASIAAGILLKKGTEPFQKTELHSLEFPSQFKDILPKGMTKRFYDYLKEDRGFGRKVKKAIAKYDLKCCLVGAFKFRIILPVIQEESLVGWTSRTIHKGASLRYMHLSNEKRVFGEPNIPLALLSIKKDTVYNFDNAMRGGKILIVTEGPFDCQKVDLSGSYYGVKAVAVYNTSCTMNQIYLLKILVERFERVVVMLDPMFEADAMRMASEINSSAVFEITPSVFKGSDLGDLKEKDVLKLASFLLNKYCKKARRRIH